MWPRLQVRKCGSQRGSRFQKEHGTKQRQTAQSQEVVAMVMTNHTRSLGPFLQPSLGPSPHDPSLSRL